MRLRTTFLLSTWLANVLAAFGQAPSNCSSTAFAQSQADLADSTAALKGLIATAHSHRPLLDTTAEEQVLGLAQMFATFATADFDAGMTDGSLGEAVYYWLVDHDKWSNSAAGNVSLSIPCQELSETATEVARATAALQAAINETVLRKPLLSSNPMETNAVFSPATGLVTARSGANAGSPRFPAGQCGYACFIPPNADSLSQLRAAGPLSDHSWIGVSLVRLLLPPPNATAIPTAVLQVNKTELARLAAATQSLHSSGYAVHVYLRQSPMPDWLPDYFGPAAAQGDANQGNADFNYDSDAALTAWGVALEELLPALAAATDGDGAWTFMACNEAYASAPATPNSAPGNISLARFRSFLQDQYSGSISALNAAWASSFASFADIVGYPSSLGGFARNAAPGLSGTTVAAFADYNNWLLNRTSWFYGRLTAQIRAAHDSTANALVHIKNKNYGSWFSWNNGFDREAISRFGGVVGVDTRDMPGETGWTRVSDRLWNAREWALDWRAPAVSYAYMRSIGRVSAQAFAAGSIVAPGIGALCNRAGGDACSGGGGGAAAGTMLKAPVFDSETHFSSVSSKRVTRMSWHHGHSSSLLAAAYGLGISSSWYWNREANGTLVSSMTQWEPVWGGTSSAAGGESMLPAFLAGTAQAARDANSAPASLAALLDEDAGGPHGAAATACLLHCGASRFVSANWSVATLEGFAGLALASTRAQLFVTDRQLEEGGLAALTPCGAVVVPACGYADDAVVYAVGNWTLRAQSAGSGALFVFPAASTGPVAFAATSRGEARDPAMLSFLQSKVVQVLQVAEATSLATQLDTALRAHSVPRAVICQPVGGVLCKWAVNGTDTLLFALNVRSIPLAVSLVQDSGAPMPGTLVDEATGFAIGPAASIDLAAGESRLLRIVH